MSRAEVVVYNPYMIVMQSLRNFEHATRRQSRNLPELNVRPRLIG